MTQRVFFSKESVLDTAFGLAREKGWDAVSARSIARRLGSSTMPIYSGLRSMGEIERQVRDRAETLLREFQLRGYTDNAALNLAVGYVAFAREEPNLFRFLYVDRPRRLGNSELEEQSRGFETTYGGNPALREMIERIPHLKTNPLILKTWIFVHGLASLVGSGALDITEERVRQLLNEAGGAFLAQEAKAQEASGG